MSMRDDDRERGLQDLAEARRAGTGPESETPAERAEVAAYGLVFDALAEDPGDFLPLDFAERVVERAFAPRLGFAWWENVVVPIFMLVLTASSLPVIARPLAEVWEMMRPLLEGVPLGLLAAAGAAVLLAGMADRVAGGTAEVRR
ncbi:MAG TPA: hypothetical protein VHG91_13885 [Longimicrobium sp.]|nr:hypothetical protein [Longimicrobium sp.]